MFTTDLLDAIGAWQRGWREDFAKRAELGAALQREAALLAPQFRRVNSPCFRKRFLFNGDFLPFLLGALTEGVTSWTTQFDFAKDFRGLWREDAVTGAIFSHHPAPEEVVINIPALWRDPTFRVAAERYRNSSGSHADALFNFSDTQGEVVLNVPIRPSDIVALSGKSSSFDDLCAQAGIIDEVQKERAWAELGKTGRFPEEYQYILQEQALGVMARALDRFENILDSFGKRIPPA